MIFVFVWLTSLSMIISRSINVAANGKKYLLILIGCQGTVLGLEVFKVIKT